MTKTVRKNSKQFAAALAGGRNFRVYSLENGFTGTQADAFPAWVDKSDLTLVATERGYTARIHSNFWVEFEAAA